MLSKPRTNIINSHLVNIFAFLFFVIATAFVGRSVLANLDDVIIGEDTDVYINPWADWWTLRAWQDPEINLWQTDYIFYPQGANLTFHSFSHLNTLVSLILRPLLGNLPAYNITILLNFVLTGFAMFQLARYSTGSAVAGLLAGIVFAFNSHSLYQSAHPVLVSIWCFPWVTLYFLRAIRENRIILAVVAAIFVFLGAATSILLIILMGMWLVMLIIYMYVAPEEPRPSWRLLLVFASISGLLIAPLVFHLLQEAIYEQNDSFVIDTNFTISTNIFSLFVPHWLVWATRGVYLGFLSFYLLLLAFAYQRRSARLWLWLIGIAFLFSIGPDPVFAEWRLPIRLPWSLWVVPVLRHTHRISILVAFGMAMAVAYGWLGMASELKSNKARYLATIIFVLGISLEFTISTTHATPISISSFYTDFLKNVPDDVALATLPAGRQEDKRYLLYQTFHEHKITGGVISRASEDTFDFIVNNPLLRAGAVDFDPVPIPEDVQPSLDALAAANVGYLVLDKTLLDDVEVWRSKLPRNPVFEDDLVLVYETGLPIPSP